MNLGRVALLWILVLWACVAAAECDEENLPLTIAVHTQTPLTNNGRRGNGSCYWGYRMFLYNGQKQCIKCPWDYQFGVVNGVQTCYRCPWRYTIGSCQKKDLCIFRPSPNSFSYKPF